MVKFETLGELLVAYRNYKGLNQTDLAVALNVDNRTIIRWEKNTSLLKPDKEEELAEATFIPYQVIRNLNAPISIPTFYDFKLRKFALHEVHSQPPHVDWLRSLPKFTNDQLQTISNEKQIQLIKRCLVAQGKNEALINSAFILKIAELLPELNFILFDTNGFYSGHCLIAPVTPKAYSKVKDKSLHPSQLSEIHLAKEIKDDPIFLGLDINADSNENLFGLFVPVKAFFDQIQGKWTFASFTSRTDTELLNQQFGNSLIWKHQSKMDNSPVYLYERVVSK